MNNLRSKWKEIGTKKIRSDAPCGESVRYDPSFEQLQSEMSHLESLSDTQVNWKEVIRLGREILQEKSKDLLVASYVCIALFEEERYSGLLEGLNCLLEMVKGFWESLYPEAKRTRGRINIVCWLSEKGGTAVKRKQVGDEEKELLQSCVEKIEAFERLLLEKLGEQSPGLGELRRATIAQLQSITAPTVISKEGSVKGKEEQSAAGPTPSPSVVLPQGNIKSLGDEKRVLREAESMIRRAAVFARREEGHIPWPYRFIRALAWRDIDDPPEEVKGRTRIPAPHPRFSKFYQALAKQEKWTELLRQTEAQFQEYPLWLDLNRCSVLALNRLGSKYTSAKEGICLEVYSFLKRIPSLPESQFSDGTPFADESTRTWIANDILHVGGENSGSMSSNAQKGGEGDDKTPSLREKAEALSQKGQLKEAVSLFQEGVASATSSRDRFLIQYELAKFCVKEDSLIVAVSIFDSLEKDIDRFSLEKWEPLLTVEVLQTFWRLLSQLAKRSNRALPERDRQSAVVLERLCRLDPVSALDLLKSQANSY